MKLRRRFKGRLYPVRPKGEWHVFMYCKGINLNSDHGRIYSGALRSGYSGEVTGFSVVTH